MPFTRKAFHPRFHLFVAASLWENEVKFRWPRLSAQYHKVSADDTHGTVLAVANRAGSNDRSDLNGYTVIRSKHCTARSLLTVCLEQTSDRYRIRLEGDLRLYE
jgi:hypothetical protein